MNANRPGYEWEEAKRQSNIAKHRVGFTAMDAFEWETARIEPDDTSGEPRWTAKGYIGPDLHVVVYAERNGGTRIISLRRAKPREIGAYADT